MDAQRLKELDAQLYGHDYPNEMFEQIAPHVAAYQAAAAKLRALQLGDKKGAFVMLAGGKR